MEDLISATSTRIRIRARTPSATIWSVLLFSKLPDHRLQIHRLLTVSLCFLGLSPRRFAGTRPLCPERYFEDQHPVVLRTTSQINRFQYARAMVSK